MAEEIQVGKAIGVFFNFHERAGDKPAQTGVLARVADLLWHPAKAWSEISEEEGGLFELIVPYVVCAAGVPAIAGFILSSTVGSIFVIFTGQAVSLSFGSFFSSVVSSLCGTIVGLLLMGKVLEMWAARSGRKRSWVLACRVVAYAGTPSYLASGIAFIPLLGWLFMLFGAIRTLLLLRQGYQLVLANRSEK
jgi:hypothetical protein